MKKYGTVKKNSSKKGGGLKSPSGKGKGGDSKYYAC